MLESITSESSIISTGNHEVYSVIHFIITDATEIEKYWKHKRSRLNRRILLFVLFPFASGEISKLNHFIHNFGLVFVVIVATADNLLNLPGVVLCMLIKIF